MIEPRTAEEEHTIVAQDPIYQAAARSIAAAPTSGLLSLHTSTNKRWELINGIEAEIKGRTVTYDTIYEALETALAAEINRRIPSDAAGRWQEIEDLKAPLVIKGKPSLTERLDALGFRDATSEERRDTVAEYLERLPPWDGTSRLASVLDGPCIACNIEADIGSEDNPHPVPEKYHVCVADKSKRFPPGVLEQERRAQPRGEECVTCGAPSTMECDEDIHKATHVPLRKIVEQAAARFDDRPIERASIAARKEIWGPSPLSKVWQQIREASKDLPMACGAEQSAKNLAELGVSGLVPERFVSVRDPEPDRYLNPEDEGFNEQQAAGGGAIVNSTYGKTWFDQGRVEIHHKRTCDGNQLGYHVRVLECVCGGMYQATPEWAKPPRADYAKPDPYRTEYEASFHLGTPPGDPPATPDNTIECHPVERPKASEHEHTEERDDEFEYFSCRKCGVAWEYDLDALESIAWDAFRHGRELIEIDPAELLAVVDAMREVTLHRDKAIADYAKEHELGAEQRDRATAAESHVEKLTKERGTALSPSSPVS